MAGLLILACSLDLTAAEPKAPSVPATPTLRVPATEPAKAIATFEALDGFRMELVAHEPQIAEPIVICYDENGLMYAAEYLAFPKYPIPGKRATGRIRLLRDADGDGRYEESHVFADGIGWPNGVCPWKGGVFVIAAPDLWYLKDTDGDGVADVRRKVFTGFGFKNEEGAANNLIWGLDGWIYGAGSNSGGEVRPADQPNARPVSISGRDFRFDPVSEKFEAISGAEQFGNAFDDWNNRFICQNSSPAVQVMLPAHYLARNPYLPVAAVRKTIWQGEQVYRISPPEPWRLERSRMRLAMDRKWAPTYVSHDVFTAVSGVAIYRGAAYPEKYRGNLFVGEVQGNLIHRRVLRPNGVSFESVRADENTEMVRSKDNWFRPVNLVNAPDGTLHIVDMYREVIETPDSLPEEIIARLDFLSGRDRGRIYRLAPPGFKVPPPPRLGRAATKELVAQLENRNGWWRDAAQRLLHERQDQSAIEPLRALANQSQFELARLHALYTLRGLGALREPEIASALDDSSAGVREHALRLAEPQLARSQKLRDKVMALADDANARVRFQCAFTLGETDDPRAAAALARIAVRDAGDVWIRTAVLSSALNLAGGMIEQLVAGDAAFAASASGQQFLRQLASLVGSRNQPAEVRKVLKAVEDSATASQAGVRRSLVMGLGEGLRHPRASLDGYLKNSPSSSALLAGLIRDAQATLARPASSAKQREQAIEMLAHGTFEEVKGPLAALLDARQPPGVQLAAVHVLAGFDSPAVPGVLLPALRTLSPAVRGEAVEALLGRSAWIVPVLDAVRDNGLAPGAIDPARRGLLMKHKDPAIRDRAAKLFASTAPNERTKVVAQYRSALELAGDPKRGQQVFEQTCMTCHKIGKQGQEVGPNLATIQNRTPEALMIQILDPNREVLPSYTQYVAELMDGRTVSGFIVSESPTSLTLKRAEGVEETILRQNIAEITSTSLSLMPEGLEQTINHQQMSDLLAFLLSLKQ